jgi:hypothetical protein
MAAQDSTVFLNGTARFKNVSNGLNANISSYIETSGVNVIKLFSFVADDEAK